MQNQFVIDDTVVKLSLPANATDAITIRSVPYNYTVNFISKADLIKELQALAAHNKEKHFIYIDDVVDKLYTEDMLSGAPTTLINAREKNKNLATAMKLVDVLQAKNFTKKEVIVSMGGGITQDITAFARAVFKRGINWVYVPTTLLSMADSCIGAKSCLNYKGGKNQLGLFSSPARVLICDELLRSLPKRDILSGYGEIVKLVIVGGETTIKLFEKYVSTQHGDVLHNIIPIIQLSLAVKNSVITIDEFEANIRKALNYGHTVGHAIEPLLNYKIPHGIAISIGMLVENEIAVVYGSLAKNESAVLKDLILPYIDAESISYLKKLDVNDVLNNMKKDKKNLSDEIFLAIPYAIGKFGMLNVKADNRLKELLANAFDNLIAGTK
ncbi:3-dehydroquinate synthase [Mucilaginibacter mali]|uniref:3-dehydroquinate synthase n=1 Tax=Mucilaginibacter mali TaxID=2740462 RepID=A0A7D4Q9Q1_9SPHI|nr:3-dehydroquinate synthase family protein [Mucilaginibacter mali]QKJ31491.1 3-dehydroquinate synthase [Mucilaginibacter mali]